MGKRKLTEEEKEWRRERAKIRRQERKKEKEGTEILEKARKHKKKTRSGKFLVDSKAGYWKLRCHGYEVFAL